MKVKDTVLRCATLGALAAAITYGQQTNDVTVAKDRKLQDGTVRPASCGTGTSSSMDIQQENSWCSNMDQTTVQGSLESCCSSEVGAPDARRLLLEGKSTPRELDSSGLCRAITLDNPYCDETVNPGCTAYLGESDVLTLNLDMASVANSDGACCDVCRCYGDPQCVSFSGATDEWILCDARHPKHCRHKAGLCKKQIDHAGNKCKWIKNTKDWTSWQESGSPCQPDWSVSGHPSMTMYEADGFKLEVYLGERGVITSAKVSTKDGSEYTLNADDCFNQDPRVAGSTPVNAWSSTSGSVPSTWTFTTPNEVEVWWHTLDQDTGIMADIVCTKSKNSDRARLNIQNLIEISATRDSSSGFCKSGVIDEKKGSWDTSLALHDECLRRALPGDVQTCMALTDMPCKRKSDMEAAVSYWCENADLQHTELGDDVEACKTALLEGEELERVTRWATYVCEINQLEVEQCLTELAQFGWETFLETKSDGIMDGGNTVKSCASSVADYSKSNDSCEQGISVEYYDTQKSEWLQAFFIPSRLPPCNNKLVVNADQHKELFTSKVRFSQCDLSTTCLASNSCRASQGFSVTANYKTENCPTPAPTYAPICATAVTRDTPKGTQEFFEDGPIKAEFKMQVDALRCTGDANVYHVGCGAEADISIDMKDCSTTPIFTVRSKDGVKHTCEGTDLPMGEEVDVYMLIQDKKFQVFYNNDFSNAVCDLTMSAMLSGGEKCIYESNKYQPAAGVCFESIITSLTAPDSCHTCRQYPSNQKVCEDQTAPLPLGACDSCCTQEEGFVNPTTEGSCRMLSTTEPYCNNRGTRQEKNICRRLKGANAKLTIDVTVDDDSDLQCCSKCICYGDPECANFAGHKDKWILCDARGASCSVSRSICSNEKDHEGNTCVWDAERAKAIKGRADIGAVGSPCQPNWAVSGKAWMEMYGVDDFMARISLGERGVIEELELTTAAGVFTLVADKCYSSNLADAFNEAGALSALRVTERPSGAGQEKVLDILEPATGIFIRVTCIERVSRDKKYRGYRLNINGLYETSGTRLQSGSATGYCVSPDGLIAKGSSTTANTDKIYEQCQQGMSDVLLLCKSLTDGTCTPKEVKRNAKAWCSTANLKMTTEECANYIGKSATRWQKLYCEAISAVRQSDMSKVQWVEECVADIQIDGADNYVEQYGQGTVGTSTSAICGASETDYSKQADSCEQGISVEYQRPNGSWVQELFIPMTLLPCDGKLEISAQRHYNLFVYPIRFKQCSTDPLRCPVSAGCLPSYGMEINYLFSHDDNLCPAS